MAVNHLPSTTHHAGEMLSSEHVCEKLPNRDYQLKNFQNIQFLARKGIAMWSDLDETDCNFTQDDQTITMKLGVKIDARLRQKNRPIYN